MRSLGFRLCCQSDMYLLTIDIVFEEIYVRVVAELIQCYHGNGEWVSEEYCLTPAPPSIQAISRRSDKRVIEIMSMGTMTCNWQGYTMWSFDHLLASSYKFGELSTFIFVLMFSFCFISYRKHHSVPPTIYCVLTHTYRKKQLCWS